MEWGPAEIEPLLRACPALLARYYPEEAESAVKGHDGLAYTEFERAHRAAVVTAFVNSFEFRSGVVRQYYGSLLHRPAPVSAAEVALWANSPLDILGMKAAFASTGDFYANG